MDGTRIRAYVSINIQCTRILPASCNVPSKELTLINNFMVLHSNVTVKSTCVVCVCPNIVEILLGYMRLKTY